MLVVIALMPVLNCVNIKIVYLVLVLGFFVGVLLVIYLTY